MLFQLCAVGRATWTELSTSRELTFVGYTQEMIESEAFQEQMRAPGRLMRGIAPGAWGKNRTNREPVMVVAEFTGPVVNAGMSDEVAYDITAAFRETLPDLRAVAPFSNECAIETATFGAFTRCTPGRCGICPNTA